MKSSTGPVAIFDRLSNYWYGSADRSVVTSFQNLAQMERGQGNVGGSMSYVTGSHNFKVGGVLLQSYRDVYQPLPAAASYTFAGQVPESVTLIASPLNLKMRTRQIGLYAQEQWTLDRLTVYGGLRFDYDRGWNPAQDVPAGPSLARGTTTRFDNVPNWKDINPRMGAAFDLFGNGRTAVKANLGRFVAFEANSGINFSSNPANAIATNATRVWTDANRDYVPQESELGPLSNANFGRPIQTTQYSDEVMHGWGNRGYNWQGGGVAPARADDRPRRERRLLPHVVRQLLRDRQHPRVGVGFRLVLHHRTERFPAAQRGRADLRPARCQTGQVRPGQQRRESRQDLRRAVRGRMTGLT